MPATEKPPADSDEHEDPDDVDDVIENTTPAPTPTRPTETSPALNVIRRIVIGDASKLGDMGPDVRTYPTLHAAFASDDFVRHLATASAVEIAPGLAAIAAPLRIKLPPSTHLTLRGMLPQGDAPTLPKLRFTLSGGERMPAPTAAIEMSGAKLTLQDLHVEMTVDESITADQVAMFRLGVDDETHVELTHSILTLKQSTSQQQPQAAFFDVLSPTVGTAMMGGMPSVLPIDLRDTIVRGDALLVRMQRSLPLDLVWSNGLFISNQRLLQIDGAKDRSQGVIRLTLRAVTIATGEGLCLLRNTVNFPHQLPLELESNECIFQVRDSSSLIEHDVVGDMERYAQALTIRGSNNFYSGVDVFWRLIIDDVREKEWRWEDWSKKLMLADNTSYVDWFSWQRSRDEVDAVPVSRRGVDDYLVKAGENNPAMRWKAGFDSTRLPTLLRIRPMPPEVEPLPPPPAPAPAAVAPTGDSL
jgi:hypothetical protein